MRSKKQIAAGQRRSLRAMREKVINMQQEWDGVDQCCVNFLDDLAGKIEETAMLLVDDEEPA
jgi:hypothetical protein